MNTKKIKIALGFDVDGETLWLARDKESINKPVTMSLGAYGLIEGMPRILKLLEKNNIKATFFIPGMTAEKYPEVVKKIDEKGHEVGNHGYTHTHPHKFEDKETEQNEYLKTNEILEKLINKKIKGYRSPAWEFSLNTVDILKEMNFLYSSNMMHTDSVHILEYKGEKTGIVEIPIHWALDDAAFWLYSISIVGKSMQPIEAVENFWKTEFDCLYEEFMQGDKPNAVFALTCHPQVIGRPARLNVLKNVIEHIKEKENVEFCTCSEIANEYLNSQS